MINSAHKVLIAISQPLTEAGISAILSESSDFEIVEFLHSPVHIFEKVAEVKPDLLIFDYNIPGLISIEDLEQLLNDPNPPNTLVISSDDNRNSILRVVQSGIKGYITKDCGKNEFLHAVQSTIKGERFFCSKILDIIIEGRLPEDKEQENTILTLREKEILKLLAQGNSTQRIADKLHLSPHTVQTHRKSIIRKLKIKSPTQFVIYALDMGLISQK